MKLRANLPPLPGRLKKLPLDERGYPVPYFVAWVGGKPDFRVIETGRREDCFHFRKCWVCGETLGRIGVFVIGPMCAVNRVTSEPASHKECAEFAAKACPFLTLPKMERREGGLPEDNYSDGVMLKRNPGVCLLWASSKWKRFSDGRTGWLIDVGEPIWTAWFALGRPARRAECLAAIESGMPLLESMCEGDARELAHLKDAREKATRFLPASP